MQIDQVYIVRFNNNTLQDRQISDSQIMRKETTVDTIINKE